MPADPSRALEGLVQDALDTAVAAGALPLSVRCVLEEPLDAAFGDFTCRAAVLLARRTGGSAERAAAAIVERLRDPHGWLDAAEAAGPGYVNLRASLTYWRAALAALCTAPAAGEDAPSVVLVREPADGLADARAAILADGLARLLGQVGHRVERAAGAAAPDRLVTVTSDADGVARTRAAVAAAGGNPSHCTVVRVGPTVVRRGARRLAAAEARAALGSPAARLAVLAAPAEAALDLDVADLAPDRIDNPWVLLQYAIVRGGRADAGALPSAAGALDGLGEPARAVLRAVGTQRDVRRRAARRVEPERVVAHARVTAAAFHRFCNRAPAGAPDAARALLARGVVRVVGEALDLAAVDA